MKRITLAICSALLILSACNNDKKKEEAKTDKDGSAKTDTKKDESAVMPDTAAMRKNWEAYMAPGDVHKMMASWDGTWNSEVTSWMSADTPPAKSKGTAVNKMVLGGRYQESVHHGDMMGMPFDGHGTLAYDNAKKVFISTWIDNMGSGIMMIQGPWDDATKSCTLTGKSYNPSTGKDTDFREVFKVLDDNNQMMEMYGPGPDGKEFKMVEIKFSRKK